VRVLLLAGTAEARALAVALHRAGIPALASLAGSTRAPTVMAIPTRAGGFGGAEGFLATLDREGIGAVVDATHPFAARITARTHALCVERGLPHLRLERSGWREGPGDRWTKVADETEAIARIPRGATVFLATGRQSLPAWAELRAARVHLRVIDPPTEPFPFPGGWVVSRPPFDTAAEAALFARLGVTHLVAKDAGGTEGRTKFDAARGFGLAVLLIRRPPAPEGLETVATVGAALEWVEQLRFRSLGPTPGAGRGGGA